jgi:hypothetical protein
VFTCARSLWTGPKKVILYLASSPSLKAISSG